MTENARQIRERINHEARRSATPSPHPMRRRGDKPEHGPWPTGWMLFGAAGAAVLINLVAWPG